MKYIKKQSQVEAKQLTTSNFEEVEAFLGYPDIYHRHYYNEVDFVNKTNPTGILVKSYSGDVLLKIGDYVVKEFDGSFVVYREKVFIDSFVPV